MADSVTELPARPHRTPREEREHRCRRLVLTLRLLSDEDLVEGVGGHVTARDPLLPDHFWINPFGLDFSVVTVADLLLVDHDGRVVEGSGTVNEAGYVIHSRIHAAHPEVTAVVHTHSVHGRAWAALGRPLDPITQDSCAFFERHVVHEQYGGVVLDVEEGERIAASLPGATGAILRSHGLLTVGASVEEAAWWFYAMDRACRIQLLAEAAGEPHVLDAEAARAARDVVGTPGIARMSFRALTAPVVRRHPDLAADRAAGGARHE